jgi:hypothetical protein
MTTWMNKTVRLPADVLEAATTRAHELGLTFTDVVEMALRDYLGLGGTASFELLQGVRDHLVGLYPDQKGFPPDVTLQVFRHLRQDRKLWRLYRSATRGADGEVDKRAIASLHRRIGRGVKVALAAKVVGRSLPLDPLEELITSHALLEPGDG